MAVRDIIIDHMVATNDERGEQWERLAQATGKLHPSGLGGCVRAAYLTFSDLKPTHPADRFLKEIFELGHLHERHTQRALKAHYGDKLFWGVIVENDCWTGEIDFLVLPDDKGSDGLIIEHKAVSPFTLRAGRIPYEHHVYQVMAYQRLLKECRPLVGQLPVKLVYRSWNLWGEFFLNEAPHGYSYIEWNGEINGRHDTGMIEGTVKDEMARYEQHWAKRETPLEIPGYAHPLEARFGCTKGTRSKSRRMIACKWFGHCWPDWPQEDPLEVDPWEEEE